MDLFNKVRQAILEGRGEQIDEISGSTLGSYIVKSKKDETARKERGIKVRDELRKATGKNFGTPIDRKLYSPTASRGAGQRMAMKKLTGQAKVNATEEIEELGEDKRTPQEKVDHAIRNHNYDMMRTTSHADRAEKKEDHKAFLSYMKKKHPEVRITEEVEELDELSHDTLKSYSGKAIKQIRSGQMMGNMGSPASKARDERDRKRSKGLDMADDKLGGYAKVNAKEEAEQIDEVGDTPAGKRALGRYIKDRRGTILGAGMGMQQQNTDRSTTDKQRKDLGRRASNAFVGVSRAVDRLTKEEAQQVDELSDEMLKSYSKKALEQSKTSTGDKKLKRQVGARNAIDRLGNNTLAKEETEQIDEGTWEYHQSKYLEHEKARNALKDNRGYVPSKHRSAADAHFDAGKAHQDVAHSLRITGKSNPGSIDRANRLSKEAGLHEESDIDEKVKNPYAVGMAAAMKATGDKPPLKKSTIIKGHEIAKGIEAKEEAELHESTMSSSDAHKLSDRHVAAAIFHKKNGNMAAYRAHADHANDITDAILRAGRDMPIRSSRLKTKSDKIFNTHPHKAVSEEAEDLEEKGLWDNIHAKRERIKRGSGERMRKPGSKGAPTAADFRAAQHEETELQEGPRGESPTAGTRLVSKHQGKDGHHAEVRYNPDWQEYQVHHYHNGKHMGEGPVSYHGEGREGKKEATETAEHATKNFHVKNGKLHMNEHNNVDEGFTIRSKGYGNVQVVKGGKVIKTFTNPQDARMHIAKINKMLKKD